MAFVFGDIIVSNLLTSRLGIVGELSTKRIFAPLSTKALVVAEKV